jgi:PAS domain S-box-containing protein
MLFPPGLKLSSQQRMSLALGVALVLMVVIAASAMVSLVRFSGNARDAVHAAEVSRTLEALTAALSEAQSEQRAYILSRDPAFLTAYTKAVDHARTQAEWLDSQTVDPGQRYQFAALQRLIEQRLLSLSNTLQDWKSDKRSLQINLLIGKGQMQEIASAIEEMKAAQLQLLARHDEALERQRLLTALTVVIGNGLSLLFLVVSFLGLMRESAERARAQSAVTLRAQEVEDLYENAPCGYLSLDPSGQLIRMNRTALRWLGYERDEVIGKLHFVDLLTPEDKQPFQRNYEQFKTGGVMSDAEYDLVRKDGSVLPSSLSATAVYDAAGTFMMSRSTLFDITQRRQAQALMREAHEFLESVLEHMPALVVLKDARDFRFLRLNAAGEEMLGLRREQVIGRTSRDLFDAFKASVADEADRAAAASAAVIDVPEEPIRTPTGEDRIVHTRKICIRNARGEATAILGISRDITARKRAEEQVLRMNHELEAKAAQLEQAKLGAEQATRAKSAFLATMSHEIRTPMNGVLGMAELLHETDLSQDQVEMVQTIRDSAASLLRIIDDILDFSKIEAGKLSLDLRPVALWTIVEEVRSTLLPTASRKGVGLTVSADPGLPQYVLCDDTRVRQVLYNLLGNAIKFSAKDAPGAGQVELHVDCIGCQADRPTVRFRIIDNGIGMAAQTRDTLFTPFMQAETSTTRRFGGTGLGLSICQRLVQLMDGSIDVESEPGKGTVFTVELPLTVAKAGAADVASRILARPLTRSTAPSLEEARAAGSLVLVADDNEINRKVIVRQLASLGIAAEVVENGVAALECWRSGGHALLLTDLHMPTMDGYELAARIRAEEQGARIPIIAFTANVSRGEPDRCVAVGMDDYLTKPVQSRALRAMLEKWMRMPSLTPGADAAPGSESVQEEHAKPVLDLRALVELVGGEPEVLSELLGDYCRSLRESADELKTAWARGATEAVQGVAHRLKSSSRSVGALALGEICERLEAAGSRADLAAIHGLVRDFEGARADFDTEAARMMKDLISQGTE